MHEISICWTILRSSKRYVFKIVMKCGCPK